MPRAVTHLNYLEIIHERIAPITGGSERLDMAFRKILTVPKEALVREEAKEKRQRQKRRGKKAH
ncbi:MAG TPA: hypothetical protein VG096_24160 [Bryobacteraceae bacterium]|nr:hypothetical protein [Bryobacteraceae bacterium]